MILPTTKKESFQFGFMMCFGMVLVITIYNFYLNEAMGELSFTEITSDFFIGFIIAFILDLLIVGPIAKKIALKFTAHTTNQLYTILAISTCMVIGMAFFMSMYGVITTNFHTGSPSHSIMTDYNSIFGKNLVLAWPLQILIVGPLVRFVFTKLIQSKPSVES